MLIVILNLDKHDHLFEVDVGLSSNIPSSLYVMVYM